MAENSTTATTADTGAGADNRQEQTAAGAATSVETKTAPATLAGGAARTETATPAASDWPEDWRERIAGDDEKTLKQLSRLASPADVWKKARSLEQKLSSGEYRRALAKDATAEEVATWRKENGLPDKPEGYLEKLALPNGVVLGDADKPVAESFAKLAMERNWSPEQYNDAVAWYYQNLDQQMAARDAADADHRQKAEDELRADWPGQDYRRNLTAANNLIASWPEEIRASILLARMPDGKLLGDHPAFIRQLAALSLELNPAATLVPTGTTDAAKGINDQIASIEAMMGDRNSEYWKGPKSESIQKQYRELIEARDKMQSRAA